MVDSFEIRRSHVKEKLKTLRVHMDEDMAEDARNRRRNAKAKFTRKENELIKSLDERRSMDIVKRIFMGLNEAWTNVEAKHDNYCTFLSDEDCAKEEPWITELQERFTQAMEKHLYYEKAIKTTENAFKLQEEQKTHQDKECSKLKRMV